MKGSKTAGAKLKRARHPLSLRAYAARLGVSKSFLRFVEVGERKPSPDLAVKWEQETGIKGLTLMFYPVLRKVLRQK